MDKILNSPSSSVIIEGGDNYEDNFSSQEQNLGAFREESLPLITFNNDTQKFETNQELIQILQNLKGPIGIIAVAGQYRTGKSYLLNRLLLNRQKGFGVGPSINPCTKGLWIWGTPIPGYTQDGTPINVLVVDSEGIGGLDEDNNHDMRIFSLAMLLSSYFLYNSVGSIDENALQNLSLVTNLTKHIQLKSSQSQGAGSESDDDSSGEELSQYMPSFMWVVRDFALQLCDEEGNDINSKEYLEKALQERGQDSKNEIRRHLKKFFKDRECCTMIRPLTNEEELQNLESMDIEELRPEFIEQVMQLRRKVINGVKPKSINNQPLDAIQWFTIVEQYVEAINEGCVPNIHSSWTYICRQNASKALEQCKQQFENELNDVVQIPMNHEDLETILKDQREQALNKLQKALQGDQEIHQDYLTQLTEFIDSKSSSLLISNQHDCRQYATELLTQLFSEFDSQIKQQQQLDINHIDNTLKELHAVYDQNSLDFSDKQLLLAEAKAQFLFDLLFQINKRNESDFELQRQLDVQAKERLEIQLREAKEDARNERQRLEDRLRQAMLEKSEMEANYSFAKEQYESLKQQKEEDDKEYKDLIRNLKEQTSSQSDEFRTQKDDFEEKLQQMQRHLIQSESEFDKERALFDQKMEFLEKSLQEKQAKERELLTERQSHKTGLTSEMKQIQQKYEIELKSLQSALEEQKEHSHEVENKLKLIEEELYDKSQLLSMQETTVKQQLTNYQDQVKTLEATISSLRRDSEQKLTSQTKDKDEKIDQQSHLITTLEAQLKDIQESLKNKEHEFMKESALRDQKYHFMEMQLQDLRDQLDEAYRQHEQVVKAMKNDLGIEDEGKRRFSPSKIENLQQELQRTQEQYQQELIELTGQNEHLVERVTELELQLKLSQTDESRETTDLKQSLTEANMQRFALCEKLKLLEMQKVKIIEENETQYKEALQRFEDETELKNQQTQQELKDMQEKSEEALKQLKNFYEIEKETLEQRINEERDKSTRRIASFQEEIELRLRDELSEKDEEIECLQNDLRESESRHQAYVTQMEHELSLKQHMCDTLERQVRDSRERIEYLEFGKNSAFEKQIEHFEQQRQEYNHKIDKLQIENLDKDRQLAQVQHKLERLNDDVERRKADMEQLKASADKEKKMLNEKLESTKKKLFDTQDEAMKQKLEFGREQALSKQQIEFQNKKIDELQKQTDDATRFFDEKIKVFKMELQDESQAQIERITSEKELWENKYEQKRRALKEIEMSLSKSNNELEKKVQQLQTVIERIEDDKRQMDEQYQDEIAQLNQHIQQLDSSAGAAYYYGSAHAEDVIKLKQQVQDLERELSDLQSHYDRDKALWEGKCQFLESQKETYKRDLNESQKKFEITLEQLQKRGNLDKDKMESNQMSMMRVVESKFKNQIKDMTETHQTIMSEAQQKMKRLENELKLKNEQMQMDARGKHADYSMLEKKVMDLSENEKRLLNELEEVKAERDRRVTDYQRQVEKDKEVYRQKLSEYENKAKESESRRAALMFEFEKERAKWQMERDNLLSVKTELTEQVEKLQVRKDQLLRENEKLRTENKGSRKYLFGGNNSNLPPHNQTSATNTSQIGMMGQNITNTSQLGQTHHNSTSATRYMVGKSMSSAVGNHMLNQAITKMKENNKYIGSGPSNRLGSASGSSNNMMMGSNGGGMDEEQVNIGSMSGTHTNNTTPVTSKHYNRYGN